MLLKIKDKKSVFRFFVQVGLSIIIISSIPIVRKVLFPDQITRIYKILQQSKNSNCNFTVERIDKRLFVLNFKIGSGQIMTTEIYKGDLRELEEPLISLGRGRCFFAHSINFHVDGTAYLTRTLIATDADMKHILQIEASVCDKLQDQTGHVDYIDYEPIIKCAEPVSTVICAALEGGVLN